MWSFFAQPVTGFWDLTCEDRVPPEASLTSKVKGSYDFELLWKRTFFKVVQFTKLFFFWRCKTKTLNVLQSWTNIFKLDVRVLFENVLYNVIDGRARTCCLGVWDFQCFEKKHRDCNFNRFLAKTCCLILAM